MAREIPESISEEEVDAVDYLSRFFGLSENFPHRNAVFYGPMSICNSNEIVDGIPNPFLILQFVD